MFSERRADFVSPACDLCCPPSDPAALSTTGQGRCDPHAEDGENQAGGPGGSLWVCGAGESAAGPAPGRHPRPGKIHRRGCL